MITDAELMKKYNFVCKMNAELKSKLKQALTSEIEFLEKVYQDLDGDESNVIGDMINKRIAELKGALE